MALDSCSLDVQFSEYERLVAEYRAVVIRCQAELDQVAASERELRAFADEFTGPAKPDVELEIGSALTKLHSQSRTSAENAHLSKREREVFARIGEGFTTQEIAVQLNVAISTVETYRDRLKHKLNLTSANALVRQAVLWVVGRDSLAYEPDRTAI